MVQKRIVVIAGPTGSGETTFTNELLLAYPQFTRAVSATTRAPRPGEVHGEDYYFFDAERFFDEVHKGTIPEHTHARNRDAYYGTYLPDLEQKINSGRIVVVNTDLAGARFFKQHYGAVTIFIQPKSLDVIMQRLVRRNPSITKEELAARMEAARKEITEAAGSYDYTVFNTDGEFAKTILDVVDILRRVGFNVD